MDNQQHNIILYQTDSTKVCVSVCYAQETFWMTQKAMSELFGCTTDNISLHLKKIYIEQELEESATTEFFSVVQNEMELFPNGNSSNEKRPSRKTTSKTKRTTIF